MKPLSGGILMAFAFGLLGLICFFNAYLQLPIHVALCWAWVLCFLFGLWRGIPFSELQNSVGAGIQRGIEAVLILLAVGGLIGTWMAGGIVPALVYYGLDILNPNYFLPFTLILSALSSLVMGTSWGTVGTTGLALMGIGEAMGIPLPWVAGAILSGAYFGDQMSPLSDSTILTASMSEVGLRRHIYTMAKLSLPVFIICLGLYAWMGTTISPKAFVAGESEEILRTLEEHFYISPIHFLPPIIVMVMMVSGVPSLASLFSGMSIGLAWCLIFQQATLRQAFMAFYTGAEKKTGLLLLDKLLARGGLEGSLGAIFVILMGLGLSGLINRIGVIDYLSGEVFPKLKKVTDRGLTFLTILVGILGNVFGSAMYVSLILTPRLLSPLYKRFNVDRILLARRTEIGGTLTSALVPWSDNGVYMATLLGVSVVDYAPYLWFPYLSIFASLLVARNSTKT